MTDNQIITKDQVEHIAHLCRIELREGDSEKFSKQLEEIIGYVNKMQSLNTEGIDPTFLTAPLFNVLRKDEVKPSLTLEQVLLNAPDREDNYFKMPRILGTDGAPKI
jgi:aspartyl-tRNA(Asn)/glutamyl-tRNA(Gln) amidotransferase subunit C